jgi:hypothetical protein
MALEELPPSLKVLLKAEALQRGVDPENLLAEILAGGDPLPPHISEFIRAMWNAKRRWSGIAE